MRHRRLYIVHILNRVLTPLIDLAFAVSITALIYFGVDAALNYFGA